MPICTINLIAGRPSAQLEALVSDVAAAMGAILNAPKERLRVWVNQVAPEAFVVFGQPASLVLETAGLSGTDLPVVQFHLLAGRPKEQHHALIAQVTDIVSRVLGVAKDRIRVFITEVHPDSFGIGGVPASIVRGAEIAARAKE